MPRTRAQIETEYRDVALIYGDRIFKASVLQNEIKALHDKLGQLKQEVQSMGIADGLDMVENNIPIGKNEDSKVE